MDIKNLAFLDKRKLKNLNSFVESEIDLSVFNSFLTDYMHNMLPFKLKFLDESFVSVDNKDIKGLITISKTGEKRVKIKRLLLDENSFEIGKNLVNYTVSNYFLKGADSFYAVVDRLNTNLKTMFVDGCGFQVFAKENVYKISTDKNTLGFEDVNFEHIRKMKFADLKVIQNLTENHIVLYKRPFFLKSLNDFKKEFFQYKEKYVISDGKKILGYFAILKLNQENFLLEFFIDKGYEGFSLDIIKFAHAKLIRRKDFKNLFVKIKSYYTNFDDLTRIFDIEYSKIKENEILYKGFLIPQKQEFKYERMIFNDITPAF